MDQFILSPIPKDEFFKLIRTAVSDAMTGKVTPDLGEELLNREQLKQYTGIGSDVTVIRLERLGVFKPIRLGRRCYYRKAEVAESLTKLQTKV